jgi:hypothetical protein
LPKSDLLFHLAVADTEEVSLAAQEQLAFGDDGRGDEHLVRKREDI